jgi:predicted membrane protein
VDADKYRRDLEGDIHRNIDERMRQARRRGGLAGGSEKYMVGIILILVGVAFLLDHMGVIHLGNVWNYWPMILVLMGIGRLFSGEWVGGVVMLLVGSYFQLEHFGILHISWGTFWPILPIIAGILMIAGHWENRGGRKWGSGDVTRLNEFALFGGVERRVTVNNFQGGRVQAIFGGVELDLRGADMEGNEVVIEAEAIFGGVEMVIPDKWIVAFEGQSIFGGYSDETRAPMPDVMTGQRKTLIIRGRAVFGGIAVKN